MSVGSDENGQYSSSNNKNDSLVCDSDSTASKGTGVSNGMESTDVQFSTEDYNNLLKVTIIVGSLTRLALTLTTLSPLIMYGLVAVFITVAMVLYCMDKHMDKHNVGKKKFDWKRICVIGPISGVCIAALMDCIIPLSLLHGAVTGMLLPIVVGVISQNAETFKTQIERHLKNALAGCIVGSICYMFNVPLLVTFIFTAISTQLFVLLHGCTIFAGDNQQLDTRNVRHVTISAVIGDCVAVAINLMFPAVVMSEYISTALACTVVGAIVPTVSEKLDEIIIQPMLEKICKGMSGMDVE
jgi:hypothetical protein